MQVEEFYRVGGKNDATMSRPQWHIIGEYPPQPGGVSDYTALVAGGLASCGDDVHVWCAPCSGTHAEVRGVTVHRELGAVTPADLRRVSQLLDRYPAPRRLLVQWVPHAYGYRSMNVGFCRWLKKRAAAGDRVELMAHETYLPFGRNWRQLGAALVHRWMTVLILGAATRVWMSIPEWESRLRPYALGRDLPFRCLPVPSNITVVSDPDATAAVRRRYAGDSATLIGHFGTHGWPVTTLLEPILSALSDDSTQQVLLMGIGSQEFREALVRKAPRAGRQVQATGALSPRELSLHVAACDLLIQPYPDGVSSRRTSVMVGLEHGKPIVTTYGSLTSPFWKESQALVMAAAGDTAAFVKLIQQLRQDSAERGRISQAARKFYADRFALSYTVGELRGSAASKPAGQS
jgi:glycosyltransferase involved in cell wall biosynthesis